MTGEPRGLECATTTCFVGIKPGVVGPFAPGYSRSLFHAAGPLTSPGQGLRRALDRLVSRLSGMLGFRPAEARSLGW